MPPRLARPDPRNRIAEGVTWHRRSTAVLPTKGGSRPPPLGGVTGGSAARRDTRGLGPLIVPRLAADRVARARSVIGLALSVYLTYEHYTASATLACSDNGVVNCLQVTTSAQSKVFGIPVALLGLVYFAAMLPVCLPVAWRSRPPWLRYGRIGAGIVGIALCSTCCTPSCSRSARSAFTAPAYTCDRRTLRGRAIRPGQRHRPQDPLTIAPGPRSPRSSARA